VLPSSAGPKATTSSPACAAKTASSVATATTSSTPAGYDNHVEGDGNFIGIGGKDRVSDEAGNDVVSGDRLEGIGRGDDARVSGGDGDDASTATRHRHRRQTASTPARRPTRLTAPAAPIGARAASARQL
jgi:hypothetical protein